MFACKEMIPVGNQRLGTFGRGRLLGAEVYVICEARPLQHTLLTVVDIKRITMKLKLKK
jgi:hypothetical protein